jgi:hypothetical protein
MGIRALNLLYKIETTYHHLGYIIAGSENILSNAGSEFLEYSSFLGTTVSSSKNSKSKFIRSGWRYNLEDILEGPISSPSFI